MQLWTYEHVIAILPALFCMLASASLLRHFLKDKPLHIRMIPFQIISILLLVLEVGKQIISLIRGYDLYHLPFHFCSLFIFMMPLMSFYKGKYVAQIRNITATICTSVVILMAIYPNLIFSTNDVDTFSQNYMAFHTVVFHNFVIFAWILILALDLSNIACPKVHSSIALFTIGFCLVSAIMAQVLQTNFNNFYSCNVPPLENLRLQLQQTLGYGVTQICYVLIVTLLDIGFVQVSFLLFQAIRKYTSIQNMPQNKNLAVN